MWLSEEEVVVVAGCGEFTEGQKTEGVVDPVSKQQGSNCK